MFDLAELESVIPLVRAWVPPTPQYAWPPLKARFGVEVVFRAPTHPHLSSIARGVEFAPRSPMRGILFMCTTPGCL